MKEEAAKHLPLKCPVLFFFGVHTSAMNYQRTSTDVPTAEQLAQLAQLALCLQPLQSPISTLLTPPPVWKRTEKASRTLSDVSSPDGQLHRRPS